MAANGLDHYLGVFADDAAANAHLAAAGWTAYRGLLYSDSTLVLMKIWDGIMWIPFDPRVGYFSGTVRYVSTAGNDADDGLAPDRAKLTITAAIGASAVGDAVISAPGTYAEAVNLNLAALQFWPQHGTIIAPGAGVPLTVSAAYCRVSCPGGSLRCNPPAGGTGVLVSVTGGWTYLSDIRVPCISSALLGFDIVGGGCVLDNCRAASPLTAAFKIQGDKVKLDNCCTGGEVADTSIGFWITNSCDKARLRDCSSQGNVTAGFQFDEGCTNILAKSCDSGGGDGHFIDNAMNTFLDITDRDSREEHDEVYPVPDGEGTAGDPVAMHSQVNDETGADDTVNYYGDAFVIMGINVVSADWFLKGANFFAATAADDQRFHFYRVERDLAGARNGGNAWDEGATVLTLTDAAEAAQFEVDDLVWVMTPGYKPDGEIVKVTNIAGAVVTIARQTENSGRTGLHWNHTTNDGGNEAMYLCWRDEAQYHSSNMDFSASGSRAFERQMFHKPRRLHRNDGIVARMINGTDDANSQCGVTLVWSD